MAVDYDKLSDADLLKAASGDNPDTAFEVASNLFNVPLDLARAVQHQESGGVQSAVSPKGARGRMQLMPGTAKVLGVNSQDEIENIFGGVKYLSEQLREFGGDPELALAAYNAGPNAVKKHGGVPPYKETQGFVSKILGALGPSSAEAAEGRTSGSEYDSMTDEELLQAASKLGVDTSGKAKKTPAAMGGYAEVLKDTTLLLGGGMTGLSGWYKNKFGEDLRFSGRRTNPRQTELYAKDVAEHGGKPSGYVAKPGYSKHESGEAIDLDKGQAAKIPDEVLAQFGLHRPLKGQGASRVNEPWHIEVAPVDYDSMTDEQLLAVAQRLGGGQATDPAYGEGYGAAARRGFRKGMIDVATRAAGAIDPASLMTGMGIMPGPDDPAWGASQMSSAEKRKTAQGLMTQALFPHGEPPKAKGWTDQLVEDLVETWPAAIGLMTLGAYGAPAGELLGWLGANIVGGAVGFGLYGLTEEDPLMGAAKGVALGAPLGAMKAVTAAIPNWIARWSTRIGGGAGLGYGAARLEGADADEARKQAILFAAFELFAKPGEYVSPREWSRKVGLNVTEQEVTKAKSFWDKLQDNYRQAKENAVNLSEEEYGKWVGQEYGDASKLPVSGTAAQANLRHSIVNEMEAIRAASLQHPESPVSAKELADALDKDPDYKAAVALGDTAKRDAAAARVQETLEAVKTAQSRGETVTPLSAENTELYLRKAAEERQRRQQRLQAGETADEQRSGWTLDERGEWVRRGGPDDPDSPMYQLRSVATSATGESEPEPLWYSRTERFLDRVLPGGSDGATLARLVQGWADKGQADKQGNVVHHEELKWSGLVPWLEEQGGRKVSKEEVLAKLREGQVEVREVEKSSRPEGEPDTWEVFGDDGVTIRTFNNEMDAANYAAAHGLDFEQTGVGYTDYSRESGGVRFKGYMNLPAGAENYRERYLTLPGVDIAGDAELQKLANERDKLHNAALAAKVEPGSPGYARFNSIRNRYEAARDAHNKRRGELAKQGFRTSSAHEIGDPAADINRFAHIFTWDMPLPGGKKMLVVGEVQSDWAREGREKGFRKGLLTELPEDYKVIGPMDKPGYEGMYTVEDNTGEYVSTGYNRENAVNIALDRLNKKPGGPPEFPFADNWSEVAMKRMVRYAAENGYDRLGWVTGDMVKDRYDLSKKVDGIRWELGHNNKTYNIHVFKDGENILTKKWLSPSALEEVVGKETTQKIINRVGTEKMAGTAAERLYGVGSTGLLEGLDLKVGGEWANRLYDSFDPNTGKTVRGLPQFVNKYAKQWGVRVEDVVPGTGNLRVVNIEDEFGKGHGGSTPWWIVAQDLGEATLQAEATFATRTQAEKFLEQGQTGDKYHSIPIVPEMKKSAPLFAVKEPTDARTTVSGEAATRPARSKYLEPEVLGADPDAPAAPRSPGEPERFTTADTARDGWVGGVPQNVEVGQRVLADFASELGKRSLFGHQRIFQELKFSPGLAGTPVFQEIAALARASGIDRIMPVSGGRFDGAYVRDGVGRRWLFLDQASQPQLWNITNHEMFHFRVSTNDPNAMKLMGSIDTNSPEYLRFRDRLGLQYYQNGLERPSAYRTMEEFAAHYVGRQGMNDIYGKPIDLERGFRDADQAGTARLDFDLRQEPGEPAYSIRDFMNQVKELEAADQKTTDEGVYKTEAEQEAGRQRARSGAGWKALYREVKQTWAPETLSKTALDTAKTYVEYLTEMKAKALRTANTIRGYYRLANQLGEDATYKTQAQYERGEKVPLEWEPYYEAHSKAADESYHDLTHNLKGEVKPYRTIGYIQNWAGRLYKGDPEVNGRVLLELNNNYLTGRKGFLKNRVFADTDIAREEMAKRGFFPAYENMVEQHQAVLMEQRRFAAADNFLDYLIDAKRAVDTQGGKPVRPLPDDWVPISFTGRTVYVPPDAAAVIRAHLSPASSPLWYAKWRDMSVAWNSWHVAWSAFHAMTTTGHEVSMGFAQNIPDFLGAMVRGDYPAAVKAAKGIGPFRVAQSLMTGIKGRQEFNEPGTHPELSKVVEAATKGGATPEQLTSIQHSVADSLEQMVRHLRGGQLTPAFRDLLQIASKPIMGYWVPRIKYGSTLLRVQGEMEKLAQQYGKTYGSQEMWSPEVLADYKARMLNIAYNERQFSDNIFGEIDPDNLHWAKHGSRILSGFVGYPGWNRGTFSWIAGMGRGVYKGTKGLLTEGSTDKIDYQARRSLQFGAGLLLTTAIANSLLGVAMGKPPEDWQDIFIGARTGGTLTNGAPERVSIASYMKDVFPVLKATANLVKGDVYGAGRDVLRIAESKLLFPFQMLKELERNSDYYGMEIITSKGNAAEKALDLGRYVGEKAAVPFGASGIQTGQSSLGKYGGFVGIRRVPRQLTNTEAQNRIDELQHARMPQARSREKVELSRLQKELRELGWAGERGEMERRLREARQQGVLTKEQVDHIRKDTLQDRSRVSFNRLNLEEMLEVYPLANEFEKLEWRSLLMKKIRQSRPETRMKFRNQITELLRQP